MNRESLPDSFITNGRIHMAVQLANEIAAKEPNATAYDCAEKAVRSIFGRWMLDHTAAVRSEYLPHFIRLVDRVEQDLGLHRRRRIRSVPTEPALAQSLAGEWGGVGAVTAVCA